MNLMFRKNFREQKCGSGKSSGGKSSASRHASKRSNREQGYTPIEEHHYRTHLFFSPPRCSYGADEDEGTSYYFFSLHTKKKKANCRCCSFPYHDMNIL